MSDKDQNFVSLGIQMGSSRLTLSGSNVATVNQYLNDLVDVDETDPDGMSPISDMLDKLETINAAVMLKTPTNHPTAPAANAPSATVPNQRSCAHGPMKFKEGISAKNGKAYKGYFCQAPYGAQKCDAQFIN